MSYKAAVITVSDRCSKGLQEDTSGPALAEMMTDEGYEIAYRGLVPDEQELIENEIKKCADEIGANIILTTGGTGFSPRDVTPEATR
ncbi:MAG: MogA/MoaB family molybdenum cofactor biosynthesis protein, partial [Oscillospiraceae bacterium]|nr:MogA/MoaB family molybdenum cofactor biosynthesis protein [Oscillospiraceae bacterium]